MTDQNNMIDDLIDEVKDPAPKTKKAPAKKKTAAKKAPAPKTKGSPTAKQLQAAADKAAKAEVKAAEKKVKDAADAADAKAKAETKLIATTEKGVIPLINAGLKAMHMVGNGNQAWTIAAFKLRELCKGTPVNFKDAMFDGWGVQKNTATKLANAGELMQELLEAQNDPSTGGVEKDKWLAHMPMGSVNNLSTISGFSDAKLDKGIDIEAIRFDSTEAQIAEFARDFNDKGVKIVVKDVPSTPAADAEDAGEVGVGLGVSESETPAELQARILVLTSSMTTDAALSLIEAIEAQHNLVVAEE